jgi:IclR family transcriptional regulator, KDG regulon repressor
MTGTRKKPESERIMTMNASLNETTSIKAVDRALDVLEAFGEVGAEFNLTRLSEKLCINKAGVHRLLQTFMKRGYVEQKSKNGKYQLGMAAYMVGQNLVSKMELLHTVRPSMEKLVREFDEAVYLVVPCGGEALFFDYLDTPHAIKVMSLKGTSYPLDACAAGEVLTAFGAPAGPGRKSQPASADQTRVRTQGYGRDENRLGEEVVSLAVPVINASQLAIGSLCIVGPAFRLGDPKIEHSLLAALCDVGHAVSTQLGYLQHFLGS